MMITAPVTHVLALTEIRRARFLPLRGRVTARVGQKVNATDVVAEAPQTGQHVLLDIRRALKVARIDQANSLIERKVGEKLEAGDVVAQAGGLFQRVVRTPIAGMVMAITGGQVLIEAQGAPLALLAGVSGTVSEVMPDRGVIIETSGALVQGAWGNGKIEVGLLLSLANTPDMELTRANLDVSMRGAVVLAGTCQKADALQAVGELPLRGLILASMSAELIPLAQQLPLPVIVLEGFGRMPMNSAAYRLLTSSEKRDVCLNAAAWDAYSGERPEVVIPLPAEGRPAAESTEFRTGQTVRVIGAPYTGQLATLEQFRPGLTRLANGLRAPSAAVRLENGEAVVVPLANLDVLE